MTDLFGIAPVAPAAPKTKGKTRESVAVDGFAGFVAAKCLLKSLEAFVKPMESAFKEKCAALSLKMSRGLKKPESFLVTDGLAKALFTLRKMTSKALLSLETQAKFTAANIPFETKEIKPELFYINPALLADAAMRQAISEALASCPALSGATIIMRQAAETVAFTSDKTIETIMKMDDEREQAYFSSLAQTPAFGQLDFGASPTAAASLLESIGFSFDGAEVEE